MGRHQSPWGKQTRQRVALEAARIMSEEFLNDYAKAKRKAADRLGITTRQDMPTNQEIEAELIAYRAIFNDDQANTKLHQQREAAVDAMKFLERFKPRLVGAVLEGSAGAYEPVRLHLFSDLPDDVVFFLMNKGIEYDQSEENVRYKSGKKQRVPCIKFHAGEIPFELYIFNAIDIREAPVSDMSGTLMKRADIKAVTQLLAEN